MLCISGDLHNASSCIFGKNAGKSLFGFLHLIAYNLNIRNSAVHAVSVD